VSRVVLLDSGPLGLISNPRATPVNEACRAWGTALVAKGVVIYVPEIADYEVRRELIRAGKTAGIRRLDQLGSTLGYLAITTATIRQAAQFWAQLRQTGMATAGDKALDGDVILAAQAALLGLRGDAVVIATTNVGHLNRLAPAQEWSHIIP
jgi:hypothetical protein